MKFNVQEKVFENEVETKSNSNKAASQNRVNWENYNANRVKFDS